MTESLQWWADGVGYQVYVPSFQDGDGDGWGDLPGVTSRLGYLADLGIVWLSPIHRSPFADHSYDVSDYRAVNPASGPCTTCRPDRRAPPCRGRSRRA